MAILRCPVFPPRAFLAVLVSSISLSRLHLGVWSQALAEVGFLIRASCHHLDRGRPPGCDSSARGLGRHCFSSWPVGARSEPLWCFPHVPPHAMAPCLPHLQRTGAHRDTRWGLGLHLRGQLRVLDHTGWGLSCSQNCDSCHCLPGRCTDFCLTSGTPSVPALFSPTTCSKGS